MTKKEQPLITSNRLLTMLIVAIFIAVIVLIASFFLITTPNESAEQTHATETTIAEQDLLTDNSPLSATAPVATAEATAPTVAPSPTPKTISAIQYVRDNTSKESYVDWIRKLSGDVDVTVGGETTKILTRYSYAMFTNQPHARAYEYLLETIRQWIPEEHIVSEPFQYIDGMGANTWQNIVLTFPGVTYPDEQVLLVAHYDSIVVFEGNAMEYAPGANDNGTGLATVLELLPLIPKMTFERTLKIILFSGEENFQEGSTGYMKQHAGDNIVGVINLDMYGTDKDGDRCFEMYVGKLEGSMALANLIADVIEENNLDLRYDMLTTNAYDKADHRPFWEAGIPAVTLMENFMTETTPGGGGCVGIDRTDCWHLPCDTYEKINVDYAFDIGLAGTFATLELVGAHPVIIE